jgi:hypothetical protein
VAPFDRPRRGIDALEEWVLLAEVEREAGKIRLLALEIALYSGDGLNHLRRGRAWFCAGHAAQEISFGRLPGLLDGGGWTFWSWSWRASLARRNYERDRAHPGNLEHDLIQMPLVANSGKAPTNLVGKLLAELARPPPHGFVADDDAAGSQRLLHHAQAEREAEIQPYGVADDLGREPIPGVAGASGSRHPTPLLTPACRRKPGKVRAKLTVPSAHPYRSQPLNHSRSRRHLHVR